MIGNKLIYCCKSFWIKVRCVIGKWADLQPTYHWCFTLHYAIVLSYRNTYLLYLCSMAFKSADFHIILKIKVGRREQFPSWDKMSLSFFAQFLGNIMPVKKNWKLGYEHSTRAGGLKYIFSSQHNRCTVESEF